MDAPQVAAKRWKSIKLEHDGREIRLREVAGLPEGNTPSSAATWRIGTRVTSRLACSPCCRKHGSRGSPRRNPRGPSANHTVKMMLPKEYHTNVVSWAKKNVARDVKRHSLRNALLITVSGDREKTAIWRLDDCELSGQTIRLQPIPARMSCDEILEWVGEEVLKEYRNLHHTRGLRPGDRDVNYVGEGPGGESAMDPAGAGGR